MTREKCEKNLEHGYFNQSDISNNAPEKWRQKHKTSLKWITFLFDYPYFRFISSPQQPLELSVESFVCLRKKRLNTFHFWSKWLSHLFQLSTAVKANNLTHFTIFPHLNPVRSHFPQRNMTHKVFFSPLSASMFALATNCIEFSFLSVIRKWISNPEAKRLAMEWTNIRIFFRPNRMWNFIIRKTFGDDNSCLFITSHIWRRGSTFSFRSFWIHACRGLKEIQILHESVFGFMDCVIIHSIHDSGTNYFWFLIRFTSVRMLNFRWKPTMNAPLCVDIKLRET